MISLDPTEQRLYEERLKVQRDERSRLAGARREGEARGRLLGQIELLRRMLGLTEFVPNEFLGASVDDLNRIVGDLENQLRPRGQ